MKSYSKTDTGATFLRMKEDHLANGQLKPAYSRYLSSSNQYITHQVPACTSQLLSPTARHSTTISNNRCRVSAYVKYNQFDRDEAIQQKMPFTANKLHYNKEEEDYYVCPMEPAHA